MDETCNYSFFKLSLALKSDRHCQSVNLIELADDVVCAAEEFNSSRPDKRLLLLNTRRKRLYLLLRLSGAGEKDGAGGISLGLIEEFCHTLCEDYEWLKYCDHWGELFELRAVRGLGADECRRIADEQLDQPALPAGLSEIQDFFGATTDSSIINKYGCTHPVGSGDNDQRKTLERIMTDLDNLVGVEGFKQEMYRLVSLKKALKSRAKGAVKKDLFPAAYIFTFDHDGAGITTALAIAASVLNHVGICEKPVYREVARLNMFYHGIRRNNGLLAMKVSGQSIGDLLLEALDDREETSERLFPVIITDASDSDSISSVQQALNSRGLLFEVIHFPDFTTDQLLAIGSNLLAGYGFTLEQSVKENLRKIIEIEQATGDIHNTRILKKTVLKTMTKVLSQPGVQENEASLAAFFENHLGRLHVACSSNGEKILRQEKAYYKLQKLVGLKPVKNRLDEILSHFILEKHRREVGVTSCLPCMHMCFSGSPGTGKTTVARLIGQILKDEGLLSRGNMVEVTRKNLVGLYVGHTAEKTSRVVQSALGGVLFIDEAYSLYGASDRDFGHEAVATLVKMMEEHKDDLVVILAGYLTEIGPLLNMNPGLRSRLPHRIDFPDYTGEELYRIFELLLGGFYRLTERAELSLREMFLAAAKGSGKENGNGRFVRNVVERLKMKQSRRLKESGWNEVAELLLVTDNDVEGLLRDKDICDSFLPAARKIGFSR